MKSSEVGRFANEANAILLSSPARPRSFRFLIEWQRVVQDLPGRVIDCLLPRNLLKLGRSALVLLAVSFAAGQLNGQACLLVAYLMVALAAGVAGSFLLCNSLQLKGIAMRKSLFMALLLFPASALSQAQSLPDPNVGMTPFGGVSGGKVDQISVATGQIFVKIPIVAFPQRGQLRLSFSLQHNGKFWIAYAGTTGCTATTPCYWTNPMFTPTYEMMLVDDDVWRGGIRRSGQRGSIATKQVFGPDASSHRPGVTSGTVNMAPYSSYAVTMETSDGTGIKFDGTADGKGVLIEPNGTRHSVPGSVGLVTVPAFIREDVDGNVITPFVSSSGAGYYVDTLNRQIPSPSATAFFQSALQSTTDYSFCTGPLPVSSAQLWIVPGPNGGTSTYKLCYGNVAVQTNFNVPYIGEASGISQRLQTLVLPDNSSWSFEYDSRSPSDPPNVNYGDLTKITFPTGGSIQYTYATFPSQDGACQGPDQCRNRAVVTRTENSGSTSATWVYNYGTFGTQTTAIATNVVTAPDSNEQCPSAQCNDTVYSMQWIGQAWRETKRQVYQGSQTGGTLLETIATDYTTTLGNPGNTFSVLPIRTTITWPNGQVKKEETDYDFAIQYPGTEVTATASYGNAIATRTFDYGPNTPGPLIKTLNTHYIGIDNSTYTAANLIRDVSSETVQDGNGNRVAETDYTYDEAAYLTAANVSTQHVAPPGPVRGNLSTVSKWLSTSSNPVVGHSNWYDTGEVYQQVDPLGHTTTHSYDSVYVGAYSTQTCNALSHCVSGTYDFNTGLLTSFTDANGSYQANGNTPGDPAHTSALQYNDPMWRLTQVQSPADPSGNHPVTAIKYPDANTVERLKSITSGLTDDAFNYFDGVGRHYKSVHATAGSATVVATLNADGRVSTVTNPYFSTSDATYGITQTKYDPLGRPTRVTKQDGSVSTVSYTDNCTISSDEAGKQRKACSDALGRLTNVWEDPAGLNYETDYQYDALGNLLRVDQKGSAASDSTQWRTRLFTYDSLSRLLMAQNPESGAISYSYDAGGNLLQKISPAPNQPANSTLTQTISYCYDALNRVTGRAYSAQTCTNGQLPAGTAAVTYSYDQGANAIGHLSSLTDQAGSGTYSYDALGRITSEQRTIAGISKSVSYEYNLDGSLNVLHYPSGAAVTYTPDSAGRMLSAVDAGNAINYVTSATYGPDGGLTGFVSGLTGSFAGITNSFSYNKRLQPVNRSASSVSQTVFSIGYDFHLGNGTSGGDNGNVWGITNYKDNTRNQAFTYDALDRLSSAQNAGTDCTASVLGGKTKFWGNNYGYDAWGNLLSKSVTKCSAENLSVTALANNQLSGYTYDAAGNMTYDATANLNYTYDQENRIAGAAGYSYMYDGDGNRVAKSNGSTGTLYWYMSPGIVGESDLTGTLKSEYIFFDGERVARKDFPGNAVSYYFTDHLKTTDVVTDAQGNIKNESDFYPWGGEVQFLANDSNHYKFTQKERDDETGLDYFGARYYSSTQGRFTSPDEFSGGPEELYTFADDASENPTFYADITEPQSLNKYQYAYNNPLKYTDPTGHCPPCVEQVLEHPDQVIVEAGEAAATVAAAGTAVVTIVKNVDWKKVGDTFVDIFKGSGVASCPAGVNCGIPQYNQSNASNQQQTGGQIQGGADGGYTNVPDPKNAGPGKKFTPRQRKEILATNKAKNGGELKSDKSGQRLNAPRQTQKGQKRDPKEAQVDHKRARSKGGTNRSRNAQVLSGRENRKKGTNDQ